RLRRVDVEQPDPTFVALDDDVDGVAVHHALHGRGGGVLAGGGEEGDDDREHRESRGRADATRAPWEVMREHRDVLHDGAGDGGVRAAHGPTVKARGKLPDLRGIPPAGTIRKLS